MTRIESDKTPSTLTGLYNRGNHQHFSVGRCGAQTQLRALFFSNWGLGSLLVGKAEGVA